MNRIQKYLSYAAMSLVTIGTTSAAWADCWLPNFGGGHTAYISFVTPGSTPTLGWARCRIVISDAGVISNSTCKSSLGVDALLSDAKLKIISSAGCEFSATFKVTVGPLVGSYSASSITLADDHLSAKGVGTFTQSGKTYGFTVDIMRLL